MIRQVKIALVIDPLDPSYSETFLFAYHYFSSPSELLVHLTKRHKDVPQRVVDLLCQWIQIGVWDFSDDELLSEMKDFIRTIKNSEQKHLLRHAMKKRHV